MLNSNTFEKAAGDSFINMHVGASVILVCRRQWDVRRIVIQAHDK